MSNNNPTEPLRNADAATTRTTFGILLAISFCHLLNDMIQSVIPSIYPMIKDEFGLTFAQIGIITLFFQLTSSILQPFVGRYADLHPRPYSLSAGMVFTLIGLGLLAVAHSFGDILVAVCCIGMGSSVFHPEASRVAQMAAGKRKGLAQSIFQVGGNGGNAIGPLLAAMLIVPLGQTSIGWFSIAAILASAVLVKVGKWYSNRLKYMARQKSCGLTQRPLLPSSEIRKALLVLLVLMFSKQFYMASMTNYFTFFLIDKFGVSVQTSQLCLFAFLAASAIGILVGGALGDKFGRKYVIWGSILGASPFTLLLPYVNLPITIALAILIGLIISSAFSAIVVYATELIPNKIGMIAGLFFGLSFGLGGIGSALFGWIADLEGIPFVFHISTVLPLLGVVAGLLPNAEK